MCQSGADRVAIVLVNYKGGADTIECLESIRSLKAPSGGLVAYVVENASPDDSLARLREWLQQGRVLPSRAGEEIRAEVSAEKGWLQVILVIAETNRGFAAGCNLGLDHAYRDCSISHFWLLNNDTVVDPSAATELLTCSQMNRDRSIGGSTLLYFDDPHTVQAAAGARYLPLIGRSRHVFKRRRFDDIVRAPVPPFDYIVGASMFFSRHVLQAVGYLPELYFLYVEEADWCARARECGISLDWARGSLVMHKEGRSTGADTRFERLSDDAFYYVSRNNLLFLWSHSRPFILTSSAYSLIQAVSYSFKGDRGKVRVALRAIRDFWRLRKQAEPVRRPPAEVHAGTALREQER